MTRILVNDEKGPMKITLGGETKWLCRCGLSKGQPFCDGGHKACASEEPGKTYVYENGVRREVKVS